MAEWQPIETFPRDGTIVLLFEQCGSQALISTAYWESGGRGTGEWLGLTSLIRRPSHWMPLPDPPKEPTR